MENQPTIAGIVERMASDCIAVRVRLINRVISALYDEALRPFGLRISQANILTAVGFRGEPRPADLCRILRLDKSTLSRDVELMKREGWLKSDPPGGGRNQVLRMTPRGEQLLRDAQPAWEQAQARARELLDARGVEAINQIASRLGFGKQAD